MKEFDVSDAVYERVIAAAARSNALPADMFDVALNAALDAADAPTSDRGACCLARLDYGEGWCLLPDSHEGMCIGKVNAEPIVVEERKTWGWGR